MSAQRAKEHLAAYRAVKATNPSRKSNKKNFVTWNNFGLKMSAFVATNHLAGLDPPACPERLTLWYYQMCNNVQETRAFPHAQWVGASASKGQHPARVAALLRLSSNEGEYTIKDICLVHFDYFLYKMINKIDYDSDVEADDDDDVSVDSDWEILAEEYYGIRKKAEGWCNIFIILLKYDFLLNILKVYSNSACMCIYVYVHVIQV